MVWSEPDTHIPRPCDRGAGDDWRVVFGVLYLYLKPVPTRGAVPLDGQDLNPLLQDPGLAFHPFLYLGYVGLSMAFSFAVAALIEGVLMPHGGVGCVHGHWRHGFS